MKKLAFLLLFTLVVSFTFAQTQMHVWVNGVETIFDVVAVDSITFEVNATEGIGIFSVSDTTQVTFSKGNLQYHPKNDEWRFAENQTDYIGDANSNCSSTYNGWLDLFGWSTSANNFGVSTSTDYDDYSGAFVDWGTNQIGADAPNTWKPAYEKLYLEPLKHKIFYYRCKKHRQQQHTQYLESFHRSISNKKSTESP